MTPFKENGQHSLLEMLYNWKHKHEHFVVENTFKIMKKNSSSYLGSLNSMSFSFLMCSTCLQFAQYIEV